MATKKEKKATKKELTPEQIARREARKEALKNRPAGQRQNSKTIDIIEGNNGTKVQNFGHVVKVGRNIFGVLVTSVAYDAKGNIISTSVTMVPGGVTLKSKKGHGNFVKPKSKLSSSDEDIEEEEVEDDSED